LEFVVTNILPRPSCFSRLSHLKRARKLHATQNIQREMHAQAVAALNREPVAPVVTARSNAMARNLARLVDGTGSLSCVPIRSVMTLKVHQGKAAKLHAKPQDSQFKPWNF
jgi:hypothetical protein